MTEPRHNGTEITRHAECGQEAMARLIPPFPIEPLSCYRLCPSIYAGFAYLSIRVMILAESGGFQFRSRPSLPHRKHLATLTHGGEDESLSGGMPG
jgi:hypothetical protein